MKTDYEIYEELGFQSDLELLQHLPRRYESLVPTPLKERYEDRERLVVRGSIVQAPYALAGGKMLRFDICHLTGVRLKAFIFGQDFYRYLLRPGLEYLFVGRYNLKQRALAVIQVVRSDSEFARAGIKPIYSLPKKIKANDFYRLIKTVLSDPQLVIPEIIPNDYRRKYRLESRRQAFIDVHRPQNYESLAQGLRVFKYEEALKYALNSICLRQYARSIKKSVTAKIDPKNVNDFVRALGFKLTGDQLKSIREIVVDLNGPAPMNRLLEGDVGTGKTAVALTALYANCLREAQGALMAPTLTLARQHFDKARPIFEEFGISVVLYDSGLARAEKEACRKKIADGRAQIVIGTHALFAGEVKFRSLGLSVIDEQHRFGVAQRTALAQKGEGSDLLMMSATPIPRTLSKIMYSDLDISYLTEFPNKIRKVKTLVCRSDDRRLGDSVDWALGKGRQVFVVAPKIDDDLAGSRRYSAKSVYDEYAKRYGSDRVGLLHGRMKSLDKEETYRKFAEGRLPILVSTTVIEVGIDVPRAALMVVYEANYFGLATLHQLRGRIGRDGEAAGAIFIYDGTDEEARKRLDFLAETTDGFKIAEYDLMMRGAGSYVGENQTGESELTVANFVTDKKVFLAAQEDAGYIYEHLDNPSYNVYYQDIRKDLFKAGLK